VSSQELLQLGAVTSVVKDDQEMEREVKKYVDDLVSSAPKAMSDIKSLVEYVSCHTFDESVSKVQKAFAESISSDEASYGIGCFINKQQPDWNQFLKSKL